MPSSLARRSVMTRASSSGSGTRRIATKSHSPVTDQASATPSSSASRPPRSGSAERAARTSTTAASCAHLVIEVGPAALHLGFALAPGRCLVLLRLGLLLLLLLRLLRRLVWLVRLRRRRAEPQPAQAD